MTKLEAINVCLSSIGEPAINTLEGASVDAQMASDIIDEASRSTQLKGWHWNREIHRLSPDINGSINLPLNTARIDSFGYDAGFDVVQRGNRLFNRETNSYVFNRSVQVELFVVLAFEELPLAAKDYITTKAAQTLQQRILGSGELNQYLTERAQVAWIELTRDDIKAGDPNMLRDNWSTSTILHRTSLVRGVY